MSDKVEIPPFLSLLEDIKSIFSEELSTQQKNNYICLMTWALKMPVLAQQLASDSFTEELRSSLIKMLAPVQDALTEIHFTIVHRRERIADLSELINNFYLSFDHLPKARSRTSIINIWQAEHGQGSIPTYLPLPPHVATSLRGNSCHHQEGIFSADVNRPWSYCDEPSCDLSANHCLNDEQPTGEKPL